MSEHCDVSLGDWDGDEPAFFHDREVMARKEHQCFECREVILKGAKHWKVSGKWDGEFNAYRFCAACWEIMGEFSECGRTFGVMWDTFDSEWHDGASLQGCLNRVTSVAAKQLMTRQYLKSKGLAK